MKIPHRFFLTEKGKAQHEYDWKCHLIVLNHSPLLRHEHYFNDGTKWRSEFCPGAEQVGCPLCDQYGAPYYGMFLTCIEVRPNTFTTRDGKIITTQYRKKLYVAKPKTHAFWEDLCDKLDTLRGVVVEVSRESRSQPSSGVPTFDGQVLSEAELQEHFGNPLKRGKDGTIWKDIDEDITPVDFSAIRFPDVETLISKYGGVKVMGGSAYNADEDYIPY